MSTKNTVKKAHTTNRCAEVAKAGRRSGSVKVCQPKVDMGKVRWIGAQVLTGERTLDEAISHVKANDATIQEVKSFLRFCIENHKVNPAIANQVIGYITS